MERPLQTQHTQPTPSTATSTVTTPRTASPAPREPDGTLRLRGGPVEERRVQWGEDVIDNEGLGRKKSKGMAPVFRLAGDRAKTDVTG